VAVVACRGGADLLRRLFEPLGYKLTLTQPPLDPQFPEWGASPYFTVGLAATSRLRDLLSHLYVLLPVLDDAKHYWVGEAEVEKLLRHGAGWLAAHPERALIARRYLKHQPSLTGAALARLVVEESPDVDAETEEHSAEEAVAEARISLHDQRLGAVVAVLKAAGAHLVLDLGCGEGRLLKRLLADPTFTAITGMDVAHRALEIAAERLHLDRLSERQRGRIQLLHGSLIYRDSRLASYDAAAVVEVIEHLDPPRLAAFERVVFEFARPGLVVLTTPNAEYNPMWPSLPAGQFRHRDHRFEWTRAEFQGWAAQVAGRFGYTVRFLPVGPEDPTVGAPTQMGVFTRNS
jgi:3' terminal RNA ribose 2'-O-methyltransferase Hen1